MAFRRDVAYLDQCVPEYVDLNGEEFKRVVRLADAKDGTDFALTDPKDMTIEQGMRLAAVYNGGPNWDGGDAQDYAERYEQHRAEAAEALK